MTEPAAKAAPVCSLSELGNCSDNLLKPSKDDRRLIKLRSGTKVQNAVCNTHFKRYITNFIVQQRLCCNVLLRHKSDEARLPKASPDPITEAMREKGKAVGLNLIPGEKMCVSCRKELFKKFKSEDPAMTPIVSSSPSLTASQSTSVSACGDADTGHSQETLVAGSQGSYKPGTSKDTFEDINKFMLTQKCDPIDLKKLKFQSGYALEQVDTLFKIFLSLAGQPITPVSLPTAVENSGYFRLMITQLQNYLDKAGTNAEKILALSVLPASMPIEKIREYFDISRRLVVKTKSLVDKSGILCTPNKKLGRPLPENVIVAVREFYLRQDISKELPGKNNFISVRENGDRVRKQKHLLMNNVRHVYDEFVKTHPEIGRSKFAEVRPKECCLATKSGMHNVCVCAIHENPTLMFNGAQLKKIPELKSRSVTDCIKFFVCNQPSPECYFRTCQKCPDKAIFLKLLQDYFDAEEVEEVTYNQWESSDRGNIITRISKVEDFEEDFISLMEDLVTHHFLYKEQSAFFNERLKTLKEGEVVIVGDFAENYSFVVQDSIQAMYFRQKQCTIHPFSVSYWDPLQGKKAQKGYAVISDHMEHNTIAFYAFQKKLLEELKKLNINVKIIYYFSDGCSGQYKNKKMVANVWYHLKDFGIPSEWHFFATSHGKSACDGIGGTIKRLATYYSKQHTEPGSQITSARRLFEWAQTNIKGVCTLWVSTQEVVAVESKLKIRFDSAYKIDGVKSCHSLIPSQEEPSVTIKKYSKAAEGIVRQISNAEDQTLKFSEVRGYIIFWDQQEPKWYLGYVNSTNEETGVISIETLVNKQGKKYDYVFEKNQSTDILFSQVLTLVNPSIASRGRLIKLKAADFNTADALLNQVKP